ncbi:DUF2867 domain-containing protein [Photobacterium sp. 1_MG-2023]|uniref:DUF2867 domain-containing protein n=1 Tax=Photobacterium sp. 1_MG-2023 TaxID=3062646 RepID=UPI0026E4960C|nr:DUF2867 domain-containing protein [Photobacterium sp. 1_MG-2023]MDO6708604.1 DUF2867 domain-containing protein [Photobacterium sp. 1_MG-2023]
MKIPSQSGILPLLQDASFYDCHTQRVPYRGQSALEIFFTVARTTPAWVNVLMKIRNQVVGFVGLKNLGHLGDIDRDKPLSAYQIGDRVGIFSIHAMSHQEVIVEDRDKHLNVRVSLYVEPDGVQAILHVTTVVHVKNRLGKLYMFFVTPMHRLIVPSSLKQLPDAMLKP